MSKEVKQANRTTKEIVKEINTPAAPSAGARQVAGKDSTNTTDTFRDGKQPKQKRHEFDAVEDKGAARRAVNRQIGETAIPRTKAGSKDDSNN
jgi:hypothetical protein